MNLFSPQAVACVRMASCMLLVATSFSQLHAQQPVPEANVPNNDPVCLSRPLSNTPQVAQADRGQAFRILAVEAVVASLEAKGFTRVDCRMADLVLAEKRGGYRDRICELAALGNEATQNQLARAFGERPAVLCAAAEAATGPWQRGNAR